MFRIRMAAAAFIFAEAWTAGQAAELILPPVFGDHMVLQRDRPVPVWGRARPGAEVAVAFERPGSPPVRAATRADDTGRWRVELSALAGGVDAGRLRIESGGETIERADVLVGEVWHASGQSNMDWKLGWSSVRDAAREIAAADHPRIREFKAPYRAEAAPVDDPAGQWRVCSPATAKEFSAAAYFFARDIAETTGLPVGILNTAWGGMPIESFLSEATLRAVPEGEAAVLRLEECRERLPGHDGRVRDWEAEVVRHKEAVAAYIARNAPAPAPAERAFADPAFDDADWPQTALPQRWERIKGFNRYDGIGWFRKTVDIPAAWNGRPLVLCLGQIDDHDIAYVNGVEVGRTDARNWNVERRYPVPAEAVKPGRAVVAFRCLDSGGAGGMVSAKKLALVPADQPDAPDALPLGGEWKYRLGDPAFAAFPAPPPEKPVAVSPKTPSSIHFGMVQAVIPYAHRGTIWYQGESNAGGARQALNYEALFKALIAQWRAEARAPDAPFLWCQLANHQARQDRPDQRNGWSNLREAQSMALSLPHTGQAVLIDNADPDNPWNIHPPDKQTVGHRLALLARRIGYGEAGLVAEGPVYRRHEVDDRGGITVWFDSVGGGLRLDNKENEPSGFALADEKGGYAWADVVEVGRDWLRLRRPDGKTPVKLRYGWAMNPVAPLYNDAGLPASPFRFGEDRAKY